MGLENPGNSILEYARDRAFKYLEQGRLTEAIDSFLSDINKEPGLNKELGITFVSVMTLRNDPTLTAQKVRDWINGLPCFDGNPSELAGQPTMQGPGKPQDFDEKVGNLLFMKKHVPRQFMNVVGEIRDMAEGGDPEGFRENYPGWTDEDFKNLLRAVGEDTDY